MKLISYPEVINKIMIVTNYEAFNKCSFARSSSNNKTNACILDIYSTARLATTATAKCSTQPTITELPKELLSTVTLTTHLLPTAKTHCSYREKSPASCYSNNNSNITSNNTGRPGTIFVNCCDSNCLTSFRTSGCNKRKMKQRSHNKPQPQLLQQTFKTTEESVAATNMVSNISPTFKFRHRKCKTSKTVTKVTKTPTTINKNDTRKQQKLQQQLTVATTIKPIPLMAARKVTTKSRSTKSPSAIKSLRFRPLSGLKMTSLFSLLTLVCLETVLLSTVSNCAKTFYMHWNTSNSIFRIDNTDHIIDVNKGNLAFEFDQVHIICPVYEPGTFENETEKYIIYNVSKVEYETCRITNADPRVIAICDKPQKLMFFTITFRPFTPQPGGLEFLPGNDYYFISTSSKDDLYRRIGGRCSTNNMKVVFKVCCAPEDKNNKTVVTGITSGGGRNAGSNGGSGIIDSVNNVGANGSGGLNPASVGGTINQQHMNSISTGLVPSGAGISINNGVNGVGQIKPPQGGMAVGGGTSGTSINTNIDQFNRIPMQTNGIGGISNGISGIGLGSQGSNGILLTPGGGHGVGMLPGGGAISGVGISGQYPGHQQSGIRINNVPSQQHPSHKNNNDDHYNKHPNEVVKNEELTYNSAGALHHRCKWKVTSLFYKEHIDSMITSMTTLLNNIDIFKYIIIFEYNTFNILDLLVLRLRHLLFFVSNINPILTITVLLVTFSTSIFKFQLETRSKTLSLTSTCKVSLRKSTKSSYLPILSSNFSPSFKTESEQCTNKTIHPNYTTICVTDKLKSNNVHIKNTYQNQR